jgi:hypothetical protein
MASSANVPLPWSGTQTCVPAPPARRTRRSCTRALSATNSRSREPQSRSIARFTVIDVVSGPGVSRYGSRAECTMAGTAPRSNNTNVRWRYHKFKPVV